VQQHWNQIQEIATRYKGQAEKIRQQMNNQGEEFLKAQEIRLSRLVDRTWQLQQRMDESERRISGYVQVQYEIGRMKLSDFRREFLSIYDFFQQEMDDLRGQIVFRTKGYDTILESLKLFEQELPHMKSERAEKQWQLLEWWSQFLQQDQDEFQLIMAGYTENRVQEVMNFVLQQFDRVRNSMQAVLDELRASDGGSVFQWFPDFKDESETSEDQELNKFTFVFDL
jgi:ATP-dependent helicase YprA (DUF1998 family)